MNYTIEFGGHPQDVTVTTSGIAHVSGFLAYLEELLSDDRFRPGMAMLFDHTALDLRPLTGEDTRTIGRFLATNRDRIGDGLHASVTSAPFAFGLVRMGHMVAESRDDRPRRVFKGRDEAVAWLAEESTRLAGKGPTASAPAEVTAQP